MPIRTAYEIQCDKCFGFVGERHDSREAAEQERAELLTRGTEWGRWLCSDCAAAESKQPPMDPVHILGIADDEPA